VGGQGLCLLLRHRRSEGGHDGVPGEKESCVSRAVMALSALYVGLVVEIYRSPGIYLTRFR
jgi:hypothetical protein